MAFKANRSRSGMGEWMNSIAPDDPRYLFCWTCDAGSPHPRRPFCHNPELISLPSIEATPSRKAPTVNANARLNAYVSRNANELDAIAKNVVRDTRPATPAQMKYLKDLFAARTNNAEAMELRKLLLLAWRHDALTVPMASDGIKMALAIRPN